MIDLQTYRARIGGAPAITSKILQRKAMAFKLLYGEMCHHEDEDLLRKVLESMAIPKRNQSYLCIIFLVTMFNVLKYLLSESHLVSWAGHYCLNWAWLQKLCVQYCWALSQVPYYLFQTLCSDSWELVYENCDTYLREVTLTICAVGLCLSSIGAVHFISILLLIAGIEPNPGPNPFKVKKSKSKDNAETATELEDDVFLKSELPSSQQGVVRATSAMTSPLQSPDPSRTLTKSETSEANTTSRKHRGPFGSIRRRLSKTYKLNSTDSNSATSVETTLSSNEDIENVEEVQSILVKKGDKKTMINLRNRNISKEILDKLLNEIELPDYDISEIDLRGSTFCSAPWSSDKAGSEQRDNILQHPKLQDAVVVTEDSIKPKSGRKSSSRTKTTSGSVTETASHSFGSVSREARRLSTQSLPTFLSNSETADSLSSHRTKSHSSSNASNASTAKQRSDSFMSDLKEAVYHTDFADKPSRQVDRPVSLQLQNKEVSREMVEELLDQIDVALDIGEVNFSHSTFLPLPWSENVDDIMDEHTKQPRLQTVTAWYLDGIGLSKIPRCLDQFHYQRIQVLNISHNKITAVNDSFMQCKLLLELDLSNNQLITMPKTFYFPRLKRLNLEENPMFEIPSVLARLPKLEVLRIGSPVTRTIHQNLLTKKGITFEVQFKYAGELRAPSSEILQPRIIGEPTTTKDPKKKKKTSQRPPEKDPLKNYIEKFDSALSKLQGSLSEFKSEEAGTDDWTKLAFETCTLIFSCVYKYTDEQVTLDLKGVVPMTPQRVNSLKWIGRNGYDIVRLIMTGQHDLLSSHGLKFKFNLEEVLKLKSFTNLRVIVLNKCKLDSKTLPTFGKDCCSDLRFIDLSENNLKEVPKLELDELRELRLEANPIGKISFDLKKVPKLKRLSLGSEETEIIGGKVLEQGAIGSLKIEVEKKYWQYLHIPLLSPLYFADIYEGADMNLSIQSGSTMKPISVDSSQSFLPLRSSSCASTPISSTLSRSASMVASPAEYMRSASANDSGSVVSLPTLPSVPTYHKEIPPVVSSTETLLEENILNVSKFFKKVKEVMDFGPIKDVLKRYLAMECVLKEVNSKKPLFALVLTSQSDLFEKLGLEKINKFLNRDELLQLNYLYLNQCELPKIPTIRRLFALHQLDISQSSVKSLANLENKSLKILKAIATSFEALDFYPDKVPSLFEVSFGSKHCQFVRFAILKKVLENNMVLKLSNDYRKNLLCPPSDCLDDIEKLENCINCTEISLAQFGPNDLENKRNYLQWLTKSEEVSFDIFNLDHESNFLQEIDFDRSDIFETGEALKSLSEVHLDDCGLMSLPKMATLSQLKIVSVKNNSIQKLDSSCLPSCIKKLKVSGNPIRCVDVDCTRLTELSELEFGSETTHYVSFPVLKRVCNGDLSVVVLEEFKKNLHMPRASLLDDKTGLSDYISNPENYIVEIQDMKTRVLALEWLFSDKTELNSREFTTYADYVSCDLHLPCLQSVDARMCSVETIKINFSHCPNLKEIRVGSCSTKYLSVDVLRKVSVGELHVEVHLDEEFKSSIMLPPSHIVENGLLKNEVERYLESGLFDVSWYVSKASTVDVTELLEILSMDDRKLLTFQMSGQPEFASKINSGVDALLQSKRLENITHLDLSGCGMSRTPAFQHLSNLCSINLSGNLIGNDVERLETVLSESHGMSLCDLNFSNTNLKCIPSGLENLPKLEIVNMSCNKIASLQSLESNCLKRLIVEENTFPALDFDPKKVPNLTEICFGSETCGFISFSVLEKAVTGVPKLMVSEKYKQKLFIPPPNLLTDMQGLDRYINATEINLQLFNTSKTEQQKSCLAWLAEHEGLRYDRLNLTGEATLCSAFCISGLTSTMLKLKRVTFVDLSDCKLSSVPDLRGMSSLKQLVLRNNAIENCDELQNMSVEEIDLENNPVQGFDLTATSLPSLMKLRIGSPKTKYISLSLLINFQLGKFRIEIPEQYLQYLIFPDENCVTDMERLRDCVKSSCLNLTPVFRTEQREAFEWVVQHCTSELQSIRLTENGKFDEHMEQQFCNIDSLLIDLNWSNMIASCSALKELHLARCSLDQMPKLSMLFNLETVDVKYNKIEEIDDTYLPKQLRKLFLEGNAIDFININCSCFPNLIRLVCGSKDTHYLSFDTVQKVRESGLNIIIQNKEQFYLPPGSILSDLKQLLNYLQAPETFLKLLPNTEAKIHALQWLLCRSGYNPKNLNFDTQEWLSDPRVNLDGISFKNIEILTLSNCQLKSMTPFKELSNVKELVVSNNNLTEVPVDMTMSSLEAFDVTNNPIREIDCDVEQLSNLKKISFGSNQTWFVSARLLNRYVEGRMILRVPEIYRIYLLLPTWEMIQKGTGSVRGFLNSSSLDVSHIPDSNMKWSATQCLLARPDIKITSLYLASEKEFCRFLGHSRLSAMFLPQLTYIFLSDCGLEALPDWSSLTGLRFADVSRNELHTIPNNGSVERMNISGNRIHSLVLFAEKFPKLTELTAGSHNLEFLEFSLLRRVQLTVEPSYQGVLIMPPACVISNLDEELQLYLDKPEKFLAIVIREKLDEAVNWLLNDADFQFTDLDFSKLADVFGVEEPKFSKLLCGENIVNVTTLNMNECQLTSLPQLEHLKNLDKFFIANNDLTELTTIKNCRLRFIDITMNPIETIDVDFEHCANVKEIKVGSEEIKSLSEGVLQKISDGDLTVNGLTKLNMSNLRLSSVPDVSNLGQLKYLNIENNNIDTLHNLKNASLTEIRATGNPIKEIDLDTTFLPSLHHLVVGSKVTKFISFRILEKVREKQLNLDIPEDYLNYFVFPSKNYLKNEKSLWEFVDNPSLDLTVFPKTEHLTTCEWVLAHNGSKLKTLKISGDAELDEESDFMPVFNSHRTQLHQLMCLSLTKMNLQLLPDLSSLANLWNVDLRSNNIRELNQTFLPCSLRKLNVQGNPILSLHIDSGRFPNLTELGCGSPDTHYITTPILKRVHDGDLTLVVPDSLKEHLYLPPPAVFENPGRMIEYINHPERFLPSIAEAENKQETLEWLFTSSCWSSSMLDFSSQGWLHDGDVHTGFVDLQNVEILILRDCALVQMPEFGHLDALKHLNLADNELKTLCFGEVMHSLETLDITNNPLEELDFDADTLPCLKVLRFGSPCIKYVSHRVLSVSHRISLDASDDYRDNLLLPTWDIIANGTDTIVPYMDCTVLRASHIVEHVDRWDALWWQINKGESTFSVINFSHDESFCDHVTEAGLSEIFSNPGLASSVTEINFTNCDLKTLPEWNSMKSLKIANLNNNKLKFVPESSTLTSLHLVDNDMRVLSLERHNFPNLVDVEAGSSRLQFITFETLKEFSVKIDEMYQRFLIMPPQCVWDNADDLKRYISETSEPVKCLIHVDDSDIKDAVLWLGNDADITFIELDLRNQSELVKHIGPDNLNELLHGSNLTNLESLNLKQCDIKELVDLEHLMKLTTLCLADNGIADIKCLSHSSLDTLDVTNNPIHTIDLNFEQCPLLKQLRAGSLNTQSVSLNVLQRIADDKLRINMGSYGDSLMLLPHFIANSNFNQTAVKQYLENGVFDTSWFGECTLNDINDILSVDERKITTLRIRNFSDLFHSDCQSDSILNCLFESPTLNDIQCLVLRNCNLSSLPTLPHLSGLSEIDLSENPIRIFSEETCESLRNITTLTLRGCRLTKIPLYPGLKQLEKLDVGCNSIQQITAEGCFLHLQHLSIDDNPIESLNIKRDQFPGLKEIKCGSNKLKFLGFELLQITHGLEKEHDSGLTITLVPEFRNCLLLPPFSVIAVDGSRDTKVEIQRYLKRPDLYLDEIKDIALRLEGLQWLVKNFPSFGTFSLSGQADVLANSQESLNQILNNQCFKEMECLDLSYCNLQKCPNLSGLNQLKSLILEGNHIEDMEEISEYQLIELNIVENPIREIRWEQDLSSKLKSLNFGSSETKFISHTMLSSSEIKLHVAPKHRDALLCPPYTVLSDNEKLKAYCRNPETILGELHTSQWIDAFEWIVVKSQAPVSTLNLSKKSELFTGEMKTRTMRVMSKENLTSLVELNLHACQLEELPILDDLPIQKLDLSNNAISDFSLLNLPKLDRLNVSGNPIETVHFNLASYKLLKHLKCGSRQTKFISFDLLEAHVKTDFQLEVDEDYESKLLMPPIGILLNKSLPLSKYLDNPDLALQQISNVKNKEKALKWIINEQDRKFYPSFSLSNQAGLCNMLGVEGLLDLCLPKLDLITELHLEQCELNYFPNVSSLANLKRLHLQSNQIQKVSISLNLEKLEEIYLTENPIKEVDFKIAYVPSLRALHFGSKSTTHVKLACLKGLVHNNVKLVNYCRSVIQFPPGEYLQGEEENNAQLLELCGAPEKALAFLDSTEKQYNLLTWIFKECDEIFEEFDEIQGEKIHAMNLKGYKSLMNYHLTKHVEPILSSPGLKAVKSLTLNSCGLEKCPNLISFPNLTCLDIGNNDLKEWPLTEHQNLKTLILSGNPLGNICDSFEGLRSLSNITLGSKSTNYITTKLLAKMAGKEKDNLVIKISRDEGGLYRKCLKLPPYSVLADDNENLSKYLKRPDQFLAKIISIDERINALRWLVNDCGETFDTFSLSGEKNLCEKLGVSGLQELFETLQTVKVLNLSSCGLVNTPDFSVLSSLSQLDLSQNSIKKIAQLGSHAEVKKLFLQGNPLKTVDVEQFPSLTYLQCGCDKKWQIDPRTLRKFVDAENSLEVIEVPSDFREPLQFPPYEVLKNGPNAVQSHMDNEELDLSGIEGANDDFSLYIPRVENAEKPIRSIRLSGVQCLSSLIESNPSFESLMAIEKLKESVEFLYIDKCNIDDYPVKIILPKLTELHLSKNVLKQDFTIPDSIERLKVQDCGLTTIPEIKHLKSLDIKGNKINCIKFDRVSFPHLTEISIGAPTRFISYSVLKLCQNGYLKLTASDELHLPPNKLLSSQEGLVKYFKSPEKYLRNIPDVKDKVEALSWLMDDRNDVIEEFDLSGQPNLCRSLQTSGLNQLLIHPTLVQNVKVLKLDNCDLTTVPEIDKLSNLKLLSLKDNKITLIRKGISNSKLEELHAQGNPIEKFHIEFVNLRSLTKITCGSSKTTIIARSVLERVSKGLLRLHVDDLYQDRLRDPPIRILQGSRLEIEAHLNKKEIDLSATYFGHTTKDTAMTMIFRKEGALSLRLSGQKLLFKDKSAVKSILAIKQLTNIQHLHMDNCNLQKIPDVSKLKQLAYLDVSNNSVTNWWLESSLTIPHLKTLVLNNTKLDRIPSLRTYLPLLKHLQFQDNALTDMSVFDKDTKEHPLETLDISGNEIRIIHVNRNSFPSLKKLTCGSSKTRYISIPLLRAASRESIEIIVPTIYENKLLVPSSDMLHNPTSSLTEFLSNRSINLERIINVNHRYHAFDFLFSQQEGFYRNLILTEQSEFCDSEYLSPLLKLRTLNTISHLYLNNCNLTQIPIPSGYLRSLQHLDLSMNKLTEINYDPPSSLQSLHINGNPIEVLRLRNLYQYESKVIQAGSEYTRYIDIPLLEFVAKRKLTIDVNTDHRKHLVLPPYEVLKGSSKTLAVYVDEIKLHLQNETRETWRITKNVALILGSSDVKSSLKAALTESSLRHAPTSNVKQVEKSIILFEQGSTIPVLSFQDSNSYEYSLDILRGQHKIVVIVVDLAIYDERNHCNQVTKWLRGFVLESNCKFILVPTALDQVPVLVRENKVALMQKLVEEWRNNEIDFLKETMGFLKSNVKEDPKVTSQHTQSSLRELERSLELFERLEIIILLTNISDDVGINKLKGKIKNLMESEQACLPFNWQKAIDFIERYRTEDTYYISFSDLINYVLEESRKQPGRPYFLGIGSRPADISKVEESVEECLRYLNAKGVIIWHEQMREYVFTHIEKVLEVYGALFRDNIRNEMRQSYHIDEHTFAKGLLSKDFLRHLWSPFRLKDHELHRIIDLLKLNGHCFDDFPREGEIEGSFLKFPFFFRCLDQMFLRDNWPQRVPHGFVQFSFLHKCFDKFPSNVMGKISTELQRYFKNQSDCYRVDWQDGIYIQTEKIKIKVQRQVSVFEERQYEQIVVSLRAHYPDIFDLWKLCVMIHDEIVNKIMETNSVVTYKKMFICPHCILTERPLESAHKIPLGEVMQSRCSTDYFLSCPNPDTSDMKSSIVPAAFFQPIIVGELQGQRKDQMLSRHSYIVGQFCNALKLDKLLWYLTQYVSSVQEVTAVGTNLGVPDHTITEKLTNNQREIRVAAREVLMTWFKEETKVHDVVEQTLQETLKKAYKEAGLSGFLDKNIDFVEAKRESVAEEMKSCMKKIDR